MTTPINQQTPQPWDIRATESDNDTNRLSLVIQFDAGHLHRRFHQTGGEQRTEDEATIRLARTASAAFDKAGRELGIDAATLAEGLDIAALIRNANELAELVRDAGGSVSACWEMSREDRADVKRLCAGIRQAQGVTP